MPNSRLERDLEQTKQMIIEMIGMTVNQYQDVQKLLATSDKDLAKEIIANDDIINRTQETFINVSIWKIAKQQMVASDLRRVIGYIMISSEFERISDYAKNICRYYLKYQPTQELVTHLAPLLAKVMEMLGQIMKVFDEEDMLIAYQIPKYDVELDKIYGEETEDLVEYINNAKNSDEIKIITSTMQQLKYIERAGDHILNVAELVIFIREGYSYDFERPIQ